MDTEKKDILILAIESSCDETAAAVVKNGRQVLSNVISSQIDLHKLYGGVVPEIASRKHIETINQVIEEALENAEVTLDDIDAIDMDPAGIVSAMLSGKVDAAATWSPNSLKILEEDANATKLTDNMTFADTTVSLASWICMPKYAEENRDVLVRFTRALLKAMDYAAADHQEETAALVAKQTALDQETVYEQRGDAEWLTGKQVSEGAADGTVEGYYELQKENFIAAGAVEVDPPVSDYVLLDVMKEAGEY